MSDSIKRLRKFAGPNGSGKSTLFQMLVRKGFFTAPKFVNADELARALLLDGIAFDASGLHVTREQLCNSLWSAGRLEHDHPFLEKCQVHDARLTAPADVCGNYVAACIADYMHEELISNRMSFAFETVMSHTSKIELFARAKSEGYRTYLYFIATDSPEVNRGRIQERVAKGGHDVPREKVAERYNRSLQLVRNALAYAYRAYFFDNSGSEQVWLAEFDPQGQCTLQVSPASLPKWYRTWVEL